MLLMTRRFNTIQVFKGVFFFIIGCLPGYWQVDFTVSNHNEVFDKEVKKKNLKKVYADDT